MVPHFPDIGSGGTPPVPQTILMSDKEQDKTSLTMLGSALP